MNLINARTGHDLRFKTVDLGADFRAWFYGSTFMASWTRGGLEEIPEFLTAMRASGSVHNDDFFLRAWLFSELFPDIGFQIIKERIPVRSTGLENIDRSYRGEPKTFPPRFI